MSTIHSSHEREIHRYSPPAPTNISNFSPYVSPKILHLHYTVAFVQNGHGITTTQLKIFTIPQIFREMHRKINCMVKLANVSYKAMRGERT